MTATVIETYRRLRRENPMLSARNALPWAKAITKPIEFDWDDGGYRNLTVLRTEFERDGFDVVIDVSYDDSPSPRYSETSTNTGIRNPRFRYNGEWQDYGNRHERYIELESGTTVDELVEHYRKVGMSKSVAVEFARKALQDEAAKYAEDDYSEYVIEVKVSVDGSLLGEASVGGVEVDQTWGDGFEREIEGVLSEGILDEAIEEARENLTPAIEKEREKLARMEALTI